MFVVVLALLVLVPLAEIAAFVAVGNWIGMWQAFALLFAVSMTGLFVVQHQGLGAWRRIRREVREGQVPGTALVDGALVLLAGVLLLVPGFLTAAVGLLLLVPPVRDLFRRISGRRLTRRAKRSVRFIDADSSERRPAPPQLTR